MEPFYYAYLHGFSSSPGSAKGTHMARAFQKRGMKLDLLDLNRPSFSRLTFTDPLKEIDRFQARTEAPDGKIRLMGSSMGGYLTARWAELNPGRVDRVVLLCPGFNLAARWPELLGAEKMQQWEREGELEFEDASQKLVLVHWGLIEDAKTHPAWPESGCPTLIIHGTEDDVVPVESSRIYAASRPHVTLLEVEDDHRLQKSMDRIEAAVEEFFSLPGCA